MRRILLVYNPQSSQYVHVREEVLSRAKELKGYMVGKFAVKKAPFKTNVAALKAVLGDTDIVIAAGGDATAAICVNAIVESGKDVTLGVLPYGNFNDLARTLRTMKFDDIVKRLDEPVRKLYPLDIEVNGEHWRYASGYVTIGMTAEAVELFDAPKVRRKLQKGRKSSWRSYLWLMKWYFRNRFRKVFLSQHKLNGVVMRKSTDYCALSGRSMCRVMKGGDDYLEPKVFRSMDMSLKWFWQIAGLMIRSILVRTPGKESVGDVLEFMEPASVELQAEGEYEKFRNVKKIRVTKPVKKFLKVIHG